MARRVIKTAHGPYELKPQGNPVLLCMCGLSKNQPFCDGSHLKTIDEEEGKVYVYDEQGKKQEIGACCQGKGCSCGSGKCNITSELSHFVISQFS